MWGQLTFTDAGVPQVTVGVLVEVLGTLLALSPHCVVLTVVAHSSAHVAGRQINGQVEVARGGVVVALTHCQTQDNVPVTKAGHTKTAATSHIYNNGMMIIVHISCALTLAGVGVSSLGRSPGQIVVKVLTALTVQSLSVVITHTAAMDLDTHL